MKIWFTEIGEPLPLEPDFPTVNIWSGVDLRVHVEKDYMNGDVAMVQFRDVAADFVGWQGFGKFTSNKSLLERAMILAALVRIVEKVKESAAKKAASPGVASL